MESAPGQRAEVSREQCVAELVLVLVAVAQMTRLPSPHDRK
jgi:hypothetical protein